jgi:outer membrane biosynthesis protein TonB
VTVPKPDNALPVSHGDTTEHTVTPLVERAKGPDSPPVPDATLPPPAGTMIPDTLTPPPPQASGGLGNALKNLGQYLKGENFNNPTGGNTQKNDSDIQFDDKGVDFGPWLARFKAQVMANWLIPTAAQVQHGHVVFQFYVSRTGALTEIHVVSPSSIDPFNSAAESALRLSNPTMPLPAEYPKVPGDHILFTVTFYYNEKR